MRRPFQGLLMSKCTRLHASFVDQSADLMFTVDLRGRIAFANGSAQRLNGNGPPGAEALSYVRQDRLNDAREFFTRQIERGITRTYYELPLQPRGGDVAHGGGAATRGDDGAGDVRWFALHSQLVRRGSRVAGLQIIGRDLGDRRRAEDAVRQSEERNRHFFEENLSAVFVAAPDGQLRTCNPAFVRLFGFTSTADALGANLDTLYPNGALASRLARVAKDGATQQEGVELRRKDGRVLHVIQSLVGRFDDSGALNEIVGYAIDDTPRKALQVQVRHAMKMEAVGRLAGGIAHDFNNLLMIIIGLSEALIEQVEPSSPMRAELDQILDAGRRGSTLASQILAFSRKPVPVASRFDVDEAITSLKPLIARLLGKNITLEITRSSGSKWISADRDQLEQVMLNLVTNAHDAMPEGGHLTIETSVTQRGFEVSRGAAPTPRVLISLRDNGHGMSPETRARIFEPFFTTKARGKGTGLGLAQVESIVTENAGFIDVQSERGEGTTFTLSLPRAGRDAADASDDGVAGHAETVLVVDDEAPIRVLVSDVLRRLGYRVVTAEHAEAALEVVREHRDSLRLAITDVVLPGRSGLELARELSRSMPQLPVLFMSGYPESALGAEGRAIPPASFLHKPFALDELALRVRQAIDRPTKAKAASASAGAGSGASAGAGAAG
jgi:two-component system cell cycle sensor histidine kinase/response regulator CckA